MTMPDEFTVGGREWKATDDADRYTIDAGAFTPLDGPDGRYRAFRCLDGTYLPIMLKPHGADRSSHIHASIWSNRHRWMEISDDEYQRIKALHDGRHA